MLTVVLILGGGQTLSSACALLLLDVAARYGDRGLYAAADARGASVPGYWERFWADAEAMARDGTVVVFLDEAHPGAELGRLAEGILGSLSTPTMDAAAAVDAQTRPPRLHNAQTRCAQRPQAITVIEGERQGDISISLKTGTFLFRVDTFPSRS